MNKQKKATKYLNTPESAYTFIYFLFSLLMNNIALCYFNLQPEMCQSVVANSQWMACEHSVIFVLTDVERRPEPTTSKYIYDIKSSNGNGGE